MRLHASGRVPPIGCDVRAGVAADDWPLTAIAVVDSFGILCLRKCMKTE